MPIKYISGGGTVDGTPTIEVTITGGQSILALCEARGSFAAPTYSGVSGTAVCGYTQVPTSGNYVAMYWFPSPPTGTANLILAAANPCLGYGVFSGLNVNTVPPYTATAGTPTVAIGSKPSIPDRYQLHFFVYAAGSGYVTLGGSHTSIWSHTGLVGGAAMAGELGYFIGDGTTPSSTCSSNAGHGEAIEAVFNGSPIGGTQFWY